MKLTKTIFLYLNEKEFSMLTKDAERANMSMSRYIRHQIDNAKMKPTKKSHSERIATIISSYIQNSILSKKIEYSQVKSLMNTQYGRDDGI